ncbi:EamA family transporter [Maritimibacter sp. 55A14]|uniref:DMT family transporter n=1 Tax=Maritimibacter sp. 55A14 TaxID=2174844 RepID=UPI000D615CFA|nr:DMT family transporter [Maritimibacter sp. 55A14]PWE29389.1 EamA family transporter [Maritimibacter sp. 55A14]
MIPSDNMRAALFMATGMAGFTLNDTCVKLVTAHLPLFETIFLRGLATIVMLAVLCAVQGHLHFRIPRPDLRVIGWRTFGEIGATICFLTALMHMPLANITAILQSLPLAVTLAAAVFLAEPVGWRRMAAIAVGFAGVMLIVRPGTEGFDRYSVLALVAVAFVVLRDLSTRRLSPGVSTAMVSLLTALAITTMGGLVSLAEGWVMPRPADLALVVLAGVFIVGGYVFLVAAMRVGEIAMVAPFRYVSLVWALVLGWAVFGDFPSSLTLLGAGVVVGTGLFTFYREHALAKAQARERLAATGGAGRPGAV